MGLTLAIETNPLIGVIFDWIVERFPDGFWKQYVAHGLECRICRGFWVSLLISILVKCGLTIWLGGYSIAVLIFYIGVLDWNQK